MPISLTYKTVENKSELKADTAEIVQFQVDLRLQKVVIRVEFRLNNKIVGTKNYIVQGPDFATMAQSIPTGSNIYAVIKNTLYGYFFSKDIFVGDPE